MKAQFLSICLLLAFYTPGLSAFIMGEDNRLQLSSADSEHEEIRQTGKIAIQGEEFVSGVVTGDNCDVVISAGHAAIYWQTLGYKGWKKGELRGRGMFQFNTLVSGNTKWQEMSLVSSGYENRQNLGEDAHDWSIFRLPEPALAMCKNIVLTPPSSVCPKGLLMPGFHFDKPAVKLLDKSCVLKKQLDNGVIVHDCDSKDGSSGAPLFCMGRNGMSLKGVNISGITLKDNYDAGVYGKAGLEYDSKRHKNFAVSISAEFKKALEKELKLSRQRRLDTLQHDN